MAYATYGEMRHQLTTEGLKWTVNPAFSDNAQVTRRSLGADRSKFHLARNVGAINVASLVKKFPSTNLLLRNELIARGILPPGDIILNSSSQISPTAVKVPGAATEVPAASPA